MIDAHTHRLKRNAIVNIDPVDIRQPHPPSTHPQSIHTPAAPAPPTGAQLPGCSPVLLPGYTYSVGIHPWNVFTATPADLRLLHALVAHPRVLAIGECGLDPNLPAASSRSAARERAEAPGAASPSARFVLVEGFSPQSNNPQSNNLQSNNLQSNNLHSKSPHSKNPFSPIPQKAPNFSRTEILAAQTALLRIHYELSETLRKPLILHIVKSFPEIIAFRKQWKPTQPWIIHGFRGKPQLARELLAHGFHLSYGKKYNPVSLAITPASRLLRETDEMPDSSTVF